jgi:transcriptional regulator with XRE-family HTH domain
VYEAEIEVYAQNVVKARRAQHLTQEQVSDRSGVHVTEVSRIERGLRDPRVSTLIRLARALDVRPSQLLDGID